MQGVKRHRLRGVAAVLAVVVAVASFSLALPGAWARRTIADADTYLSVVTPLADDPAVQEALAREITTAVFEALDVQGKLTAVLTEKAPQLTFLAGPITSSVQGFVQDQVQAIVASDQFRQFWTEANRLIQAAGDRRAPERQHRGAGPGRSCGVELPAAGEPGPAVCIGDDQPAGRTPAHTAGDHTRHDPRGGDPETGQRAGRHAAHRLRHPRRLQLRPAAKAAVRGEHRPSGSLRTGGAVLPVDGAWPLWSRRGVDARSCSWRSRSPWSP